MHNNKGFSLVELIIVVAIMAILIGVLAPQYVKYVERSKVASDENSAEILLGIAYAMISDQVVCDQLNDGDTIDFAITGISLSNVAAMKDPMDEHLADWTEVKIRSKKYVKGYKVTFESSSSNTFWVKGEWNK